MSKRLTERDEYGNADIIALSDTMPEIYAGLSFSETDALTEALNKLADYEDTGFSPDEVHKILKNYLWRSLTFSQSMSFSKNRKKANG